MKNTLKIDRELYLDIEAIPSVISYKSALKGGRGASDIIKEANILHGIKKVKQKVKNGEYFYTIEFETEEQMVKFQLTYL